MSKIEIKNVDSDYPAHGWNTKITMDGCDIGKITTAATIKVDADKMTKVILELANLDNIQINTNAEIEISGIKIPDELFEKIFDKMCEIALERKRNKTKPEDWRAFITDGRLKA